MGISEQLQLQVVVKKQPACFLRGYDVLMLIAVSNEYVNALAIAA